MYIKIHEEIKGVRYLTTCWEYMNKAIFSDKHPEVAVLIQIRSTARPDSIGRVKVMARTFRFYSCTQDLITVKWNVHRHISKNGTFIAFFFFFFAGQGD